MKQCWPAPERNKQPILEVLRQVLPASGSLLEVASGSGQHAAFFAAQLSGLRWQPSDYDDVNLASIAAWVEELRLPNLLPPLRLDVTAATWPVKQVDALFCANMIHIAPWECCVALFDGAARHLAAHGTLVTYGPYMVDGRHISESNQRFDQGLRSQDPRWGVRDVAQVAGEAARVGLSLLERVSMPANNFCLVFARA